MNRPHEPDRVLRRIRAIASRRWRQLTQYASSSSEATITTTLLLSFLVGAVGGVGALVFGWWIALVETSTLQRFLDLPSADDWWRPGWHWLMVAMPALGLLAVGWFTRRFAPEASGNGVPEVISAVTRTGGVIRARVVVMTAVASGVTIGTGGSVGREGPIVQIGAATGSVVGQWLRLSERSVKVLVASGAAAGISATFGAPLAGVMFAGEVILGNFAVNSLTPIVIAAVIANLVAQKGMVFVEPERIGTDGDVLPIFHLARDFTFDNFGILPFYLVLGLLAGLVAAAFIRVLYATEDAYTRIIPQWYRRAILGGLFVGLCGLPTAFRSLYGVGYGAIEPCLAMKEFAPSETFVPLWILLSLLVLKIATTSVTLTSGGSGGIFAPSLFMGATLGGAVGQIFAYALPDWGIEPGAFSVVGMAAVVSGTTHGPISAVLVLFEITGDYNIILPLMCAAGLSSITARLIDPESIYIKKLSRRGEMMALSHHVTSLEDIRVRDLMVKDFPTVSEAAMLPDIIRIAAEHPHVENLPIMSGSGHLQGLIRTEDLKRLVDSDMQPSLFRALDIAQRAPIAVAPEANLLDALRDFGHREDLESLPVVTTTPSGPRLIGLLSRTAVMQRYRQELLLNYPEARAASTTPLADGPW